MFDWMKFWIFFSEFYIIQQCYLNWSWNLLVWCHSILWFINVLFFLRNRYQNFDAFLLCFWWLLLLLFCSWKHEQINNISCFFQAIDISKKKNSNFANFHEILKAEKNVWMRNCACCYWTFLNAAFTIAVIIIWRILTCSLKKNELFWF